MTIDLESAAKQLQLLKESKINYRATEEQMYHDYCLAALQYCKDNNLLKQTKWTIEQHELGIQSYYRLVSSNQFFDIHLSDKLKELFKVEDHDDIVWINSNAERFSIHFDFQMRISFSTFVTCVKFIKEHSLTVSVAELQKQHSALQKKVEDLQAALLEISFTQKDSFH